MQETLLSVRPTHTLTHTHRDEGRDVVRRLSRAVASHSIVIFILNKSFIQVFFIKIQKRVYFDFLKKAEIVLTIYLTPDSINISCL